MKIAVILNSLTLAAVVGIGSYQIKEAQGDQKVHNTGYKEIHCLRKNIYFEARNQSTLGKKAVGWVTLNRVDDKRYPDTICGVVRQGKQTATGAMIKDQCQFSWYCDGKVDTISVNKIEQEKWKVSGIIALQVLREKYLKYPDPTNGADHYHADYVNPYWAEKGVITTKIDDHIFYKVTW